MSYGPLQTTITIVISHEHITTRSLNPTLDPCQRKAPPGKDICHFCLIQPVKLQCVMHRCPTKRYAINSGTHILRRSWIYKERVTCNLHANAERVRMTMSSPVGTQRTGISDKLSARCRKHITASLAKSIRLP